MSHDLLYQIVELCYNNFFYNCLCFFAICQKSKPFSYAVSIGVFCHQTLMLSPAVVIYGDKLISQLICNSVALD